LFGIFANKRTHCTFFQGPAMLCSLTHMRGFKSTCYVCVTRAKIIQQIEPSLSVSVKGIKTSRLLAIEPTANASLRDILRIMFCGPSQIDGPGCRNPDAQRGRLLSRHAPDRSSGTANGNFQERGPRRTAASSSTSSRPSTATAVNGCDSPAAWWRSNSSTCRSARAACSSRSSLQGCCLWDFWCPCSPCGVHPALLASACRRRTVRCPCLSPTCSTSSRYMIICTGCVPAI